MFAQQLFAFALACFLFGLVMLVALLLVRPWRREILVKAIFISWLASWVLLPLSVCLFISPLSIKSWYLFLPLFFCWLFFYWQVSHYLPAFLRQLIFGCPPDIERESNLFLKSLPSAITLEELMVRVVDLIDHLWPNSGSVLVGEFLADDKLQISSKDYRAVKFHSALSATEKFWQTHPSELITRELLASLKQSKTLRTWMIKHNYSLIAPLTIYPDLKGALFFGEVQGSMAGVGQFLPELLAKLAPALSRAAISQQAQNFTQVLQRKVDRATHKLRESNQQLMQADKMKDEFVAIASHELRTPMTAIKNYLWLVDKNIADKRRLQTNKKYLAIALNSVQRLIDLVNDMLTISRLDNDRFALNLEKTNLVDLVNQTMLDLVPLSKEKHLSLAHSLPKKISLSLDSKKILEVLHNVIGNAIKFTASGGVKIEVAYTQSEVQLKIIDTGSGIDPKHHQDLFRKFARVEQSLVKIQETGTGLGLYISREIMHRHGGEITLTSTPEIGSVFTLHFPRR